MSASSGGKFFRKEKNNMNTFTHPKLLAAIQKSCPELMELTFGCRVITDTPQKHKATILKEGFLQNDYNDGIEIEHEKYFEILGHEPQLHHVLRAILYTMRKNTEEVYSIAVDGVFEVRSRETGIVEELAQWKLPLGLYGQEPATLDFLEQLLVSK